MLKIFGADKDAYITDKVVRGVRVTGSNVGQAGSLDLFKLYGITFSGSAPSKEPNVELSRILLHFDLDGLRDLVQQNKIDVDDDSFWCKLKLRDVYGGQPTPANFTVSVFPLSASFDEGIGKDVSYYSDSDRCNWVSSSLNSAWFLTGCSLPCYATGSGDYITSSISIPSTEVTQLFKTGEEDLEVDVTKIVSATLSNELPDSGFRISFKNTLEENTFTYFVKRFASRHAYEDTKRPQLVVGFDDSINDDSLNLTFDKTCKINLYNYDGGSLANMTSGSSLVPVVGSNSLLLKLVTEVSGGTYSLAFTGSQYSLGDNGAKFVSGTYTANVFLTSNDPVLKAKLSVSSSIKFLPLWTSLDSTVTYVSGAAIYARPPVRSSSRALKNYEVSVLNVSETYRTDEEPLVRVNIFDRSSPYIKVVRIPTILSGTVLDSVYYQVRDAVTDNPVIPFDDVMNSTKVSSDSEGMFFKLDVDSLGPGKTYAIDIMIHHNGVKTRHMNVSPAFRIEEVES